MGQVGDLLRQTREAKGLSLPQVEEITKIRHKILEALEQGAYDQLPAPVFVKGFLRNYAVLLGLNPEEVIQKYKEEAGEATKPYMPTALAEPLEARRFPAWIGILSLILVFAAAVSWSYQQGWVRFPESQIARLLRTGSTTAMPSPLPTETAAATPTVTDTPTAVPTLTLTATATSTGTPTLSLTATATMTCTPSPTPPRPTQTATATR